jgi:hypothetical protein
VRNLHRRIAALEKASSALYHGLQAIAEAALGFLGSEDLELLISAYGADRAGRRLTEREAVARRAFTRVLARECQSAGLQAIRGFERTAYIRQAIIMGLAKCFSTEELQLARRALTASAEGDAPTESELAALHACSAEQQRLRQLAGFCSIGEFNEFCSRVEYSESGDLC